MQTTGAGSRAFTSSVCEPVTVNERAVIKVRANDYMHTFQVVTSLLVAVKVC